MSYEVLWTQYGGSAVDITDQVDFASVTLEQNASGINSLCRMDVFTLLPFGTGQYTKRDFSVRDLIRVKDTALSGDAQWLFSGFVTSISPTQEGDHTVQSLELADYTSIFDVVVIDDMTVAERTSDVQVIAQIFAHVDGITSTSIWQMCALNHQPTATDIPYIRSTSQYVFSNPDTYLVERYQGMTVKQALEAVISKTGYTYWVDEALNFHYAKSNVRDIMTNGSAVNNTTGWTAAPTGTTLTRQTSGGPFGSGTYLRFEVSGSPTGEQEVYVPTTVTGDYATTYMVTFRYRTSNNDSGKAQPQVHLHWLQNPSTVIHDTHMVLEKAQADWTTGWFMSTHSSSAPNTIRLSLTLGKSSSSGARQERIDITDIQVIPVDTTFGFLETGKSVANHGDADGFTWNDYENPSTTIEGADAKNAVRVYGAWENPTTHNLYNEYEHPRGVWAMRGRKIYANIFDQSVIDDIGSAYRAAGTFEKEGVPLRTVSFDHQTEHTSLRAGNVVPFIWETGDIAEPFIVRKNSANYEGSRFFWSSELGGDPTITQTRLYAVNVAVQNLQDYVTDAIAPQPPVSDPVTSAAPVLSAAAAKIDNDGNAKSVVTVTWAPNTEPDLRSYRVDFAEADTAVDAANFTAPSQQIIPRNQSTGTGAPATITANYNAASGKYVAARVVATDFMSNASLPSTAAIGAANAILAPLDTVPPGAPTNMLATSTIASVLISWDFDLTVTGNKDFSKFKLQRVSNSTNSFPASAWTDSTKQEYLYEASSVVHPVTAQSESASSENTQYGRFYWYRVLAVDNSGNESSWAYVNAHSTPTSVDSVAAGKVNAVDIDSINAGDITSGSLVLTPLGATSEAVITNVSGSGTVVTYTAANSFSVGGTVTITGVDPAAYNLTNATVATATSTQFTVASNAIGTYVGGGVAYLRTNTAAIQSTNFSVSNSGSVIASDITLRNADTLTVSDGIVGLVNFRPRQVTSLGVTTNVGGAALNVVAEDSGSYQDIYYIKTFDYGLNTTTTGASGSKVNNATITITLLSTHDIGVGQYISFSGSAVGTGTGWNDMNSQDEALRVVAVGRSAGVNNITYDQIQVKSTSSSTTAVPSTVWTTANNNASTVLAAINAYPTLTLVAPGGVFVAQSGTAPGVLGTGSLMLGKSFSNLGTGTYPLPADGEIGWVTTVSPKYTGGGNLFGDASTVYTSGNFWVGKNKTSTLTVTGAISTSGNISGSGLIANGVGVFTDAPSSGASSLMYWRTSANVELVNLNAASANILQVGQGATANALGTLSAGNVTVTGAITAGGALTGDLVNTLGTTAGGIRFGSEYLYFDSTDARFEFSDDVYVTGGITTSGAAVFAGHTVSSSNSGYYSAYLNTSGNLMRYTGVSEGRLKKNIAPTELMADAVYNLSLIDYEWKDEARTTYPNIHFPENRVSGFTVEDARVHFPSVVRDGENGEPSSIDEHRLDFGLLVAIQDLNRRVAELEGR